MSRLYWLPLLSMLMTCYVIVNCIYLFILEFLNFYYVIFYFITYGAIGTHFTSRVLKFCLCCIFFLQDCLLTCSFIFDLVLLDKDL